MVEPRFAGEPVELGGTVYTVPPLSLLALKTLLPTIQRIVVGEDGGIANPLESLEELLDICHAALKRNYPEMTRDALIELVDISNFVPLITATMRQSALKRVQEKNGAAVASLSTGGASTVDSPPPSAGAGSTSTST